MCPAHRYALLEKEVGERESVAGDYALWLKFLNDSCLLLTHGYDERDRPSESGNPDLSERSAILH